MKRPIYPSRTGKPAGCRAVTRRAKSARLPKLGASGRPGGLGLALIATLVSLWLQLWLPPSRPLRAEPPALRFGLPGSKQDRLSGPDRPPSAWASWQQLPAGVAQSTASWAQPLEGTSWRNRPWHASWFLGGMWGDALQSGVTGQDDDLLGGYRLGYDLNHHWGGEARWGMAYLNLIDAGPSLRSSRNILLDLHALYYPWGDTAWRAYASLGMGLAGFHFQDASGVNHNQTLFHLPIGMGLKLPERKWLAWRVELMDNIAWGGSGLDTMHNVSLTLGVEVHFGGPRPSYFPWEAH